MSRVRTIALRPNKMYRMSNGVLRGRALIHSGVREGHIISEGDITVDPVPVEFPSWDRFIAAPDPHAPIPRSVSAWSALNGDNPYLMVVSEGECWAQQRIAGTRDYADLKRDWHSVKSQAFFENAKAKASASDNRNIGTLAMVTLAVVSVLATLIFGLVVMQAQL